MNSTEKKAGAPAHARARIGAELICESALHVGDGGMDDFDENRRRTINAKKKPTSFNTLCVDKKGKPYIPAATLRGFLRDAADDRTLRECLFGPAETRGQAQQWAGKTRVYDAPLKQDAAIIKKAGQDKNDPRGLPYQDVERQTFLRHGIRIDPVTGTVAGGALFSHELVPEGSRFTLAIEADDITDEDLMGLIGLLHRWNGGIRSGVGKDKSKGRGRLCIAENTVKVEVLSSDAFTRWLKEGNGSRASLYNAFEPFEYEPVDITDRDSATLMIHADGPILCNEVGYVEDKSEENPHPADHEYARTHDNKPVIPAETLRGAARGRAQKILATLIYDKGRLHGMTVKEAGEQAEKLVGELFGDTGTRGALWFGDAAATDFDENKKHPQWFNAIDRFTGAVAGEKGEGKLYHVNAVAGVNFKCEVFLETHRLRETFEGDDGDWWKGLLLFLARDAVEGDLAVGWGKAKGYGAITAVVQQDGKDFENWEEILDAVGKENARQWVGALQAKIVNVARALNTDEERG